MQAIQLSKRNHFPTMCDWWEKRKFPSPSLHLLPKNGLVVVKGNGVPVCGGFLYLTDAKTAIMSNLVSDPEATGEERHEALDILIDGFKNLAKHLGFEMLACSTNLDKLMKRYEDHGFTRMDENMVHFGGKLCL